MINSISEVKQYEKKIRGPIGKLLDNVFRFVPYWAIKSKVSANSVTALAFALDLTAVVLILNEWYLFAGVLVLLSYVGDISDGTVARYEREVLNKPSKGYGSFLDEVLGTIGFALVVLFTGLCIGPPWLGLYAMIGIFMMNITTAEAKLAIPNKKEISAKLQRHRFENKYQIGFTCDIQRTLVALAVMFQSLTLLLLFAMAANALWILKFWIYRNH